ncbi:MAG: hypothetical protein RLY16_2304 [Bacteroidota bacterium]|jgi:cobalt-zinc-cadmium efflux system membrane fusion protein
MKYITILLTVAILGVGCSSKKDATEPAAAAKAENIVTLTAAQMKNAGVTICKLDNREMSGLLQVSGKIDVPPQNMVSISVPLGGYLKNTRLLPGMHVNKGEVIAEVEDQQYIQLQQDYLTAKARINFLEKEYLRQKELNSTQASSDKQYQQTEADYASQKILIAALAQKLQLAGISAQQLTPEKISKSVYITAPINGFVSKVNVNIGKYVSPTEVLFELVNPADIHLALNVFERDVDKLVIGQKLEAFTNNDPTKKHACEIILIGKTLSEERSTEVHCHFEVYDPTLIPGTYMNAAISLKNKKVLAIPEEAIVRFQNLSYVFVQRKPDVFELVAVKPGISQNGWVELTDAATLSNESLVQKGAYNLLMALKNNNTEEE